MIRILLLSTLLYVLILGFITAVNPALGFQLATYTGLIIAQPISLALKLGLLLRGLN